MADGSIFINLIWLLRKWRCKNYIKLFFINLLAAQNQYKVAYCGSARQYTEFEIDKTKKKKNGKITHCTADLHRILFLLWLLRSSIAKSIDAINVSLGNVCRFSQKPNTKLHVLVKLFGNKIINAEDSFFLFFLLLPSVYIIQKKALD